MSIKEVEMAKQILSYGVLYSPATEIWKICNTALFLLHGEGQGFLDMEFVEKILKKSEESNSQD